MCTKTSNRGFIFQDAYSPRLATYRDLLLRLANPSPCAAPSTYAEILVSDSI